VRRGAETSVIQTRGESDETDLSGDRALIVQRGVDESGVGVENSIGALYETCRLILAAPTESEARMRYEALRENPSFAPKPHHKAVRFLTRRWDHLMMHHRVAGMPRTTNLVENVNKQLERRYKTIEAFQYRSTAIHYTNLLGCLPSAKAIHRLPRDQEAPEREVEVGRSKNQRSSSGLDEKLSEKHLT